MSNILTGISFDYDGQILTETKTYKLWESAGQKLVEAQLTPDQISQLFANIEQSSNAAGTNRTGLGKAVDATSAVNNAWKDLKAKISNSGPVKGFDQKVSDALSKIGMGASDPEFKGQVTGWVKKYRDFANKYPMAQQAILGTLIAIAGITGAGVGGAAAIGLLRMADQLIQGKRFSSAAYSGAKAGAAAYAAGKIGDFAKDKLGGAADAADTAKTARDTTQAVRQTSKASPQLQRQLARMNQARMRHYARVDATNKGLNEATVALLFTRIDEGLWDTIKSKAAQVGKNLTTKVTAGKLMSAWKKAGSPTDHMELWKLLVANNVPETLIKSTFASMGIGAKKKAAKVQQNVEQDWERQASGTNESKDTADFQNKIKNIVTMNPKGSAAEQILLGKFLGSDQGAYARNVLGKNHKGWIEHITTWLKKNQPRLEKEFNELDFSDLESLAYDMYENYLAKQGQLEEGEVVSLQARKTPLVVAGSPYDWDIYDLRTNKMVANILGGDRHDNPLYEIRIRSSGMTPSTRMLPTYVLRAGANNNPPYKAYELVAPEGGFGKVEKSPGPGGTTKLHPDQDDMLRHLLKNLGGGKYYGYDLVLVEEGLDQYELIEKALGAKIMEIDDAMELGYTDWDTEDSSSIVYLGNKKDKDKKDEGYSAGASGGAGLGEEQAPMFTPEDRMVNANDPRSDGWRIYKAVPSGIMEGILKEYDTKTIDSVVQRLPKGLTVNNFTHPAFKEFLYQKYYAKVKADWDKLYPFFAQEYKQKHGIKEYKQDPHRIVSGDSEFFDDMLLVMPKGLKSTELYTQAFKEFLYKKFADREWTDFKKNRFTYWDAYQKIGGDKKDKKFFGLFDEEEQIDELKCWPGYTRVRGVPAGAPGSCKKKTKESSIIKGIQSEEQVDEYKEIEGQRKIEFSKENPPDLYYLYQQFIQRMLNPENTIDPKDWIEKVNNHYGLNYSWKDYQKRGHNDHTDNWQKIINKYILKK